jgi:fructokinase
MTLFGTVELGGTKTSCAVGTTPENLGDVLTIPTAEPSATLDQVIDHLRERSVEAVGVASFGPVELRRERLEYGHITTTPKQGWSGADIVGRFETGLGVPVGFDTDVNGAALGEGNWGAGQGLGSFVYLTIGTGIGGGALLDGVPVHGLGHPEMGHMSIRRHPEDDFAGSCRLHGDCLEGLASGPAIAGRLGVSGESMSVEQREHTILFETFYLTQLVRNLIYTLAPERVIMGGGVSKMPGLLDAVRQALPVELGGYPGLEEHTSGFVVPPGLGDLSGLAGGLVLAAGAVRRSG